MQQALTIVGLVSAATFIGLIAITLGVRILLRYAERRVEQAEKHLTETGRHGDRARDLLSQLAPEVDRLVIESDKVVAELEDVNRRLAETLADAPERTNEISNLYVERNRLLTRADQLSKEIQKLEYLQAEATEAISRHSAGVDSAATLLRRTRKLLRLVELISNVDIMSRTSGGVK